MDALTDSALTISKITRPHATLIPRERVCRELSDSPAIVTWLVATAGSGKTTVCVEISRTLTSPVAWLRADEADRDIACLLQFITLALVHGGVASPEWRAPEISSEHLQAPQGHIRIFLRSLAKHVQPDSILVIDDAHHCQDSPFFGIFLERWVDEMPAGVKIIIASRIEPPDSCARILSHGHMKVVGGDTLAFTEIETARLLAFHDIDDRQLVKSVYDNSRGWAILINLLISLIRRQRAANRPTIGGQSLAELASGYIANEVFAMLSEDERKLLLSTCYLPHFSVQVAHEISGLPHAQAILDKFLAGGGLVVDYSGGQFGSHDLVRQFLQKQAAQLLPAADQQSLLKQSVDLLAREGCTDEAIELAIKHDMLALAGGLIDSCAASAYAAARHQTLARWIMSIPEERRGIWHHFWLGRAVYSSDSALARDALLHACVGFAAEGNHLYRYTSLSLIISSYSFDGAAKESIREVLQKHVNPSDYDRMQSADARGNFALAVFGALLIADPGHPDFTLWESRALDALDNVNNSWGVIRIFTWLSIHYHFSGNYKHLLAIGIRTNQLTRSTKLPPYDRYLSYFGLLFISLVGDRSALEGIYQEAVNAGEATGFNSMDGHFAILRACCFLLDGNTPACESILQNVAAVTPPTHFNLLGHLNSVRAWAANWQGDTLAAHEYADLARRAGRKFGSKPYEVWSAVSDGVADALSGDPELPSTIYALRQLSERNNYPLGHIHADLLEAWHWMQSGDQETACRFLSKGLALLGQHSEGYLTSAIPQILQPLCHLALQVGIEMEVATKVVKVFGLRPPAGTGPSWPWTVSVRCFGNFLLLVNGKRLETKGKSKYRQLDLLKYLATHAPDSVSLSDVADALWPDADGDLARRSLDTTLSRLRSLIGKECIRVENSAIYLDSSQCWSDTCAADEMLSNLESGNERLTVEFVTTFVQLFRGEFLAGETSAWVQLRREYWHLRIARIVATCIDRLESEGERSSAIVITRRLLEIWPHSDQLALILMRLLLTAGHPAEALKAYDYFCLVTSARADRTPSSGLEVLAAEIRSHCNSETEPAKKPTSRQST